MGSAVKTIIKKFINELMTKNKSENLVFSVSVPVLKAKHQMSLDVNYLDEGEICLERDSHAEEAYKYGLE